VEKEAQDVSLFQVDQIGREEDFSNDVKNAIRVVEALITEDEPEAKLKSTTRNPFPRGY
jgi:hypothetical protein